MKQSWSVLRHDKELALFPLISGIASLAVLAVIAVPIYSAVRDAGVLESTTGSGGADVPPWVYVVGALFYLVTAFITIYFNSALIAAAMVRLRGGDPKLADGIRWANQHLLSILGWALITATVGYLLRALQERMGIIGNIVFGLIGLAWQLITYFVIPVILFEDVGAIEGIKRSAKLFKARWGEQVVGAGTIGIASMILSLIGIGVIGVGVYLAAGGAAVLGFPLVLAGVVYLIGLTVCTQAMQGIYNAALYKFAVEGDGGAVFTNEQLADSFVQRKGGGRAFRGFPHATEAQQYVPPYQQPYGQTYGSQPMGTGGYGPAHAQPQQAPENWQPPPGFNPPAPHQGPQMGDPSFQPPRPPPTQGGFPPQPGSRPPGDILPGS